MLTADREALGNFYGFVREGAWLFVAVDQEFSIAKGRILQLLSLFLRIPL